MELCHSIQAPQAGGFPLCADTKLAQPYHADVLDDIVQIAKGMAYRYRDLTSTPDEPVEIATDMEHPYNKPLSCHWT